ncbi:hypothetical protein N2152v2_005997 [Parachlorella kessleri]
MSARAPWFLEATEAAPSDLISCQEAHTSSALPLVCKRFHRLWNTSQLRWATLNLDPAALQRRLETLPAEEQDAALAALLRVLCMRAQATTRLWLHSNSPQLLPLAQLLELVSPHLQQVFIGQVACRSTLPLLQRFSHLRALDIPACAYEHIEWEAEAHLLTDFIGLQELTLRDGGLSNALLGVVAQLRGLKLLSVATAEPLPSRFHLEVGKLVSLEELDLYFVPAFAHRLFEVLPVAFRGLTRLRTLYILAPNPLKEHVFIGPGLADLPALQDLQIRCQLEQVPSDLWMCGQLTKLDLEPRQQQGGSMGVVSPPSGIHMPALQDLRMARCRFPGATLPLPFCDLAGLTRLAVMHCGLGGDATAPGLPLQFTCLSRLASLSLEGNGLTSVPPGLVAVSTLRVLDLSCNSLTSLPPGPYLSTLELLSISWNCFVRVPAMLCCAHACEVLDLSLNPQLELSRADVEDTLLRMPRLGLLLLGKWPGCTAALNWRTDSVAALVCLAQQRPHLEVDFEHTAAEYDNLPLG